MENSTVSTTKQSSFVLNAMLLTDGYKLGHKNMYAKGMSGLYTSFIPRSNKHFAEASNGVVVFGIQYFIKKILIDAFNQDFFGLPEEDVVSSYHDLLVSYLGQETADMIGTDHIRALHKLGYLPIKLKALKEGSMCPIGVPVLTIESTHKDFAWFAEYLETIMSNELWLPMTSATTADCYMRELMRHAAKTGMEGDLRFLCHDFSMRGMQGLDSTIQSGMGHLISFNGSESIPAIAAAKYYYPTDKQISGTVPACYSEDTEILTNSGWKYFKDLKEDDLVAQYNEDKSIEFVKPLEYFKDPYNGKMIHFKQNCDGSKIDLLVTPNHRMIRRNWKTNKLQMFEAASALTKASYTSSMSLITSGYTKHNDNHGLSALDKLKIAFQADGAYPAHKDDYTGERSHAFPIRFGLKKERKMERLEQLFAEAGVEYTKQKYANGYYSIWANVPVHFDKDFSWVDLTSITQQECIEFIEELQYWDGHKHNNTVCYSSINKSCVDKVQAIANICGYRATVNCYQDKRTDSNRKPIWSMSISKGDRYGIAMHLSVTEEDYNGYVYCVSVPSKMIVVRRNNKSLVCGNTEHSVMCSCIMEYMDELNHGNYKADLDNFKKHSGLQGEEAMMGTAEYLLIRRLITETVPSGFVSIVCDSFDFWRVIRVIIPMLRDEIMHRNGRVVVRPDSGDPVKIICGDPDGRTTEERIGAYEALWCVFGGTENKRGYKSLDSHIGLLYGDSINLTRQHRIYEQLEDKGFTASNLVLGIGSYTYCLRTRDSLGFAMKANWCRVSGKDVEIYKDPKTVVGMPKKSLKGLIKVDWADRSNHSKGIAAYDQQPRYSEELGFLHTVFKDGKLLKEYSLDEVRETLDNFRNGYLDYE